MLIAFLNKIFFYHSIYSSSINSLTKHTLTSPGTVRLFTLIASVVAKAADVQAMTELARRSWE